MNNNTDILTKLIHEVHACISNEAFPKKLALMDGIVGLLLYHSLHSELYADVEEREFCQDLISEIANLIVKSDKLDRNFFNGPLSFPYIVRLLAKMNILDYNQELVSFFMKNLMHTATLNTVPSIITGDRLCIGEALFLMSLFDDNEDSLHRYSLQESLITYIDHCGRLLNDDVPPLYYRDEMSFQYLHSIYFFLQWTQKYSIYPTKVNKLLRIIDYLPKESNEENSITHQQILHKLQDKDVRFFVDESMSLDEKLNSLAILGMYSFLYEIDIFKDFIHDVYDDSPDKILHDLGKSDNLPNKILGIGIGLLSYRLNENKSINGE